MPATTIADVLVDGVSVGAGDQLHVHERDGEPHDRRALRDPRTYTVTASAGPGGSISPSGAVTRRRAAPTRRSRSRRTPCYTIADVLVDGVSVGAGARATRSRTCRRTTRSTPRSRSRTYTITATAGPGGSISPSRARSSVAAAQTRPSRSRRTPATTIADVLVDGVSVGAVAQLHVHERAGEPHDRRLVRRPIRTRSRRRRARAARSARAVR